MRHLIENLPGSSRVTSVGLTMGASVGLFAYGGLWLDAQFGTKPWLLLLCVAMGILGSFLHMVRVLMPEKWPWPTEPEAALDKTAQKNAAQNKAAQNKATESAPDSTDSDSDNGPPSGG